MESKTRRFVSLAIMGEYDEPGFSLQARSAAA